MIPLGLKSFQTMQSLLCFLFFFLATTSSWCQQINKKLTITPLKDNLYIFTSYGSFNGIPVPANGMYLITKEGAVLFDAPWDTTQFKPLLDSIANKHHKKVILHLATHWHDDRSGGLAFYRNHGAKTFTTKLTDELCREQHKNRAEFTFDNDTIFRVGEYTFEAYYPGEGHSKDNIVIWFKNDKVLYGGCLVKSITATNLGNLDEANVNAWPQSIQNIQQRFGTPAYIITGHDSWESKESLNHTLMLLEEHGDG